jgi:diguanylate cyclase (GGDEF)-like protein
MSPGRTARESAIRRRVPERSGPGAALGASLSEADLAARLRSLQQWLQDAFDYRDVALDIVRALNTTTDSRKIAELIIDRASGWVPLPCWTIVSSDLSGRLSMLGMRGFSPDLEPVVNAVAEWVMARGTPFVAPDLVSDGRIVSKAAGAALALPLVCRGRRIGAVIGLDRSPSAREPRLPASVFRTLCELLEPASVALNNALLLERAEALSVTDDLTQLYNSRYLNQVLRRETKRASRSGRALSLLFVDLDGFKRVNDTWGHLFGSRALVEAAALIRGSARETDVVARFGGDEFALVLPETGPGGGYAVAERVRDRIAAHVFLEAEGASARLTASIGIATLPDVASSAEELVQAADRAMYRVKDSGKNGIQTAASPADN